MILTFDIDDMDKLKEFLLSCNDEELKVVSWGPTVKEIRERIKKPMPEKSYYRNKEKKWLKEKVNAAVAKRNDRYLYLSRDTKISYKEGDYETGRVIFLIPEDLTKEEILENRKHFVKMAMLDIVKKAKVSSKLLEVTEFIWRKNFHEVQVTIKLKKEILDLKEKWSEVEAI